MRAFGVRPKRDLGQNFLIDSNILGVIERAAELGPEDVVLEIGGGLGVLSEHLARARPRTRTSSRSTARWSPRCATRSRRSATPRRCTSATRCTLDYAALDPAPTKVVANLPYGIAATAILDTIFELPSVTRWVAMVQKEVGERFAASAGHLGLRRAVACSRSWRATCACTARSRAPSSTRCPTSTPCSCCSTRTGDAPPPALRALVQGAFAHRRKALATSLPARTPATRRCATAPAPRSRRSACRRTRAPSA